MAFGQTGGVTFAENPPFGTYLGLSVGLSQALTLTGMTLVAGVAVIGTILHERDDAGNSKE